jgi:hypothetical protein
VYTLEENAGEGRASEEKSDLSRVAAVAISKSCVMSSQSISFFPCFCKVPSNILGSFCLYHAIIIF